MYICYNLPNLFLLADEKCETEFANNMTFKVVTSILNFYIPTACMVVIYVRIYLVIKRRSREVELFGGGGGGSGSGGGGGGGKKGGEHGGRLRQKASAAASAAAAERGKKRHDRKANFADAAAAATSPFAPTLIL